MQEYRYRLDDGVFEPADVIRAPCELGGQIPGDADELAHAITAASTAATPYAGYMAALLLGEKEEIPLRIDGRLMFITSSMARNSDPDQAAIALDFLTLRNLLRLHRSGVTLAARVAEQTARIELFAGWLAERAEADEECRARLTARSDTPSQRTEMAHTETMLRELQACCNLAAYMLLGGRDDEAAQELAGLEEAMSSNAIDETYLVYYYTTLTVAAAALRGEVEESPRRHHAMSDFVTSLRWPYASYIRRRQTLLADALADFDSRQTRTAADTILIKARPLEIGPAWAYYARLIPCAELSF